MRQVLYTFNGSHVPSEESQKGCLSKKFPGGPQGGNQSTILINFYAKIEYVADLDYSANANSGMRQVLYTFPGSHIPSEESQKGCSLEKSLGGSQGGPKVPPRPYAEKNFCL